jgi:hypothetical protein
MKNTFYTIVCVLIVLFALANQCDKGLMRDAKAKVSGKTYDDWKNIADGYYKELEECSDELINEDGWRQVGDVCVAQHRNNWVRYSDNLDELSNLTFEERESLKTYWHNRFDLTIAKIKAKIDERERNERPNRYSQ